MTRRTHAVAKTRAHQVRWSSRCRSRAEGSGTGAGGAAAAAAATAAGPLVRVAAARGRREAQLRLPAAAHLLVVGAATPRQRGSHALLRPQKSESTQSLSSSPPFAPRLVSAREADGARLGCPSIFQPFFAGPVERDAGESCPEKFGVLGRFWEGSGSIGQGICFFLWKWLWAIARILGKTEK